ncbi:MAG: hypothetical protein IPL33_16695 [Sphingobacteriales bacterium]|nr:hypothetical protein [Sphingobacteriales bacterium]
MPQLVTSLRISQSFATCRRIFDNHTKYITKDSNRRMERTNASGLGVGGLPPG